MLNASYLHWGACDLKIRPHFDYLRVKTLSSNKWVCLPLKIRLYAFRIKIGINFIFRFHSSHSISCVGSCRPFVDLLTSSAGLAGCQNGKLPRPYKWEKPYLGYRLKEDMRPVVASNGVLCEYGLKYQNISDFKTNIRDTHLAASVHCWLIVWHAAC